MTDPSDAMMQLASACVWACMTGNKTITITLPARAANVCHRIDADPFEIDAGGGEGVSGADEGVKSPTNGACISVATTLY